MSGSIIRKNSPTVAIDVHGKQRQLELNEFDILPVTTTIVPKSFQMPFDENPSIIAERVTAPRYGSSNSPDSINDRFALIGGHDTVNDIYTILQFNDIGEAKVADAISQNFLDILTNKSGTHVNNILTATVGVGAIAAQLAADITSVNNSNGRVITQNVIPVDVTATSFLVYTTWYS